VSFLVDTDICSAYIKGNKLVFQRFLQYGGRLYTSAIVLGELFTWALRVRASPRRLQDVDDLLKLVAILDATPDVAKQFGIIRAGLMDAGLPTPDLDLLNAATALVHNLTLVTHNGSDYANVPGLTIEDWLAP
jgi:tRNA(fMet)-specific endonuclease VapC